MIFDTQRGGQSLVEVLIAIAVGVILVIAALGAIVPALTINKQLVPMETGTTLAVQLLDNVKTWSEGNWNNILSLATGTSNAYYLNTANSPFIATTGTESIVTSVNPSGLVGWWKLNEGTGTIAYDSSGNNATGSWNGTPVGSSTYYSPGNVLSQAGYFDGTDNSITTQNISLPGNATFSFWLDPDPSMVPPVGTYPSLVGVFDPGIYIQNASGKPYLQTSIGTVVSSQALKASQWQYIAGTYQASGSSTILNLYLNGVLVANAMVAGNIAVGSTPFRISTVTKYKGLLSDVRIYNQALTATQINQIYTAQKYTRSFYVGDVYRSGGYIVTSGGTYDPSTKMVTVQYQIPPGITSTISTYLTRHADNIFDQTDWSGGGGVSTPVTVPANTFASSSNVDGATSTGSFYIALPGY